MTYVLVLTLKKDCKYSYPCHINAVIPPDGDGPRDAIVHPGVHNDGLVGESVRHHGEEKQGHDVRPRRGRKDFVYHLR